MIGTFFQGKFHAPNFNVYAAKKTLEDLRREVQAAGRLTRLWTLLIDGLHKLENNTTGAVDDIVAEMLRALPWEALVALPAASERRLNAEDDFDDDPESWFALLI